jgi:hypothetical protein
MGRRARYGRDTCCQDQQPRFEKSLFSSAWLLRLSPYSAFEGNNYLEFDSLLTSENKAELFRVQKKWMNSKAILSNNQI